MKFNVDRADLLRVLKILCRNADKAKKVDPRNKPVFHFECVQIRASDMALRLAVWKHGLISNHYLVARIQADVEKDGQILIPVRDFLRLVYALPAGKISVSQNQDRYSGSEIVFSSGNFMVKTGNWFNADECFFNMSEPACFNPVLGLFKTTRRVAFAAYTDDAHPILAGIHFNGAVAATDGFRIAIAPAIDGISGTVPVDLLRDANIIFHGKDPLVWQDETKIAFADDTFTLVGEMIDGIYPNYGAVIPSKYKLILEVETEKLLSALRLINSTSGKEFKYSPVHLNIESGTLNIEYRNDLLGFETDIPCHILYKDPDCTVTVVALNPMLLGEGLAQFDSTIRLQLNGSNVPVTIKAADESDPYTYTLMPMHL
jgi:DNA polymerase III sliding clamp (beta) subunit (PCNA family)